MSDELRRHLADLADDASTALARPVTVAGLRARRRSRAVGGAAALVVAAGACVLALSSTGGDVLVQEPASPGTPTAPPSVEPTASAEPTSTATPGPAPSPTSSPAPPPPTPVRSAEPSPTSGPVVAWRPRPVTSVGPDTARPEAPAGLRRCGPSDLQIRVATDFDAPQPARRTVVLSAAAVGASDCGLDSHGFAMTFPGTAVKPVSGSTSDARPDDLVRPGDRLVLVGFVVNWCEAERGPVRVALKAAGVEFDAPGTITPPACAEQRYGSRDPQTGAGIRSIARPGSPALLVPHLQVPTSTSAGSQLRYDVELLNASDSPVRFQPCPGFSHALGDLGRSDPASRRAETHQLDCEALPTTVASGEGLTLSGVRIAAGDRTGRMTLGWSWGSLDASRFGEAWDGVSGAPVDVR